MGKRVFSLMLSRPYVPNRESIKRDGRTSPYAFLHRIAYTEALRGDNYDERVLLFHATNQHQHKFLERNEALV